MQKAQIIKACRVNGYFARPDSNPAIQGKNKATLNKRFGNRFFFPSTSWIQFAKWLPGHSCSLWAQALVTSCSIPPPREIQGNSCGPQTPWACPLKNDGHLGISAAPKVFQSLTVRLYLKLEAIEEEEEMFLPVLLGISYVCEALYINIYIQLCTGSRGLPGYAFQPNQRYTLNIHPR